MSGIFFFIFASCELKSFGRIQLFTPQILCKNFTALMLRSYLERDPAELMELKIWASSESSPGFGKVLCDSHIQIGLLGLRLQDRSRPKSERVVVDSGRSSTQIALPLCSISGWPQSVKAISSAGHLRAPAECMFHGKVRPRWRHSAGLAVLWGELPEKCKIAGNKSKLFSSTWKSR